MASALLRASAPRGSAFRRAASAAPAVVAAASGGEGLAGRRAVSLPFSPLRRLMNSGAPTDQPSKSPDEKLILLHKKMKELNHKAERGYVICSTLHKVVEERKPHRPFVQWLWQVGALTFIVFVEYRLSKK